MKILVIGVSARALAESALNSGYRVVALDAFGDRDLRSLTEAYSLPRDCNVRYSAEALYKESRHIGFDAVAYTANLENHPAVLARFASQHPIMGNSPEVIKEVRHWPGFYSSLKKAGFRIPDTMFEKPPKAVHPDPRWLEKPALSGGGHGIRFFDPGKEQLYTNGRNHPGTPKYHSETFFQQYIDGKPCSASFVANGHECVVLGIAEQWIGLNQFGAGRFRYCGNILPLPELRHPEDGKLLVEQIRQLAAFVTRTYRLIGLNVIDFILKDNEVYLTEVNPRYSASMELIEKSCGLRLFDIHARAVMYDELPVFHPDMICNHREFMGKAILFAERDAVVKDTAAWHSMGIRDIPASGEPIRKGEPICTMLAARTTYNRTFAELTERARMLKEEIYDETKSNLDNRALHETGNRHFDRKTEI